MKQYQGIALYVALISLLFVALLVAGKATADKTESSQASVVKNSGEKNPFVSFSEESYDFGSVSMRKGNVTRDFSLKNTSSEPIVLKKLSTSCMCTSAVLEVNGRKLGPFGMPGHGFIPTLNEVLEPGSEARVRVIFNPSAHGPAGIGRVERVISLNTQSHGTLELKISAQVTP